MTDHRMSAFEIRLAGVLRSYSDIDVPSVDAAAVARDTLGVRRRWSAFAQTIDSRLVRLALVVVLALAVLASVALVGSQVLRLPTTQPLPRVYDGDTVLVGGLLEPRGGPLVVELRDGRVLVVGGQTGPWTTGETFDPATGEGLGTGRFVSADALEVDAALRLRDGRVLVVGHARRDAVPLSGIAQMFDPATQAFTEVGPMLTPRADAQLALLPDGRVLMAGGTDPDASVEIFDPGSGTFMATGSMAMPRSGHALVALPDGGVLALGGTTTSPETYLPIPSAELYDAATGTWSDAGTLSFTGNVLAVALPDGRVLALGADPSVQTDQEGPPGPDEWHIGVADIWDPATRTFSRIATRLPVITGAALLDDGRVLLVGAASRDASWAAVFDPLQALRAPVPVPLREVEAPSAWHPVTTRLSDGRVLLVGGLTDGRQRGQDIGGPAVTTVEIFQ